jgi:hypothetical protein
MTRTRLTLAVVSLVILSGLPSAQSTVASHTREYVEFLASDKLEGREAGSAGERLAADFIATQLTRLGARP